MFKLEIVVDDKKLPKALIALDGLGYDLQVHPVKGAEVQQGKLREARSGTPKEAMLSFLKQHLTISGAAVSAKDIIQATGMENKIAYNHIARAILSGVMRKTGEKGKYTINHNQL